MNAQDREAARTDRPAMAWSPWGPQKISLAERRLERLRRAAEHAGQASGPANENGAALG